MSISIPIYNNVNSISRTITVDLVGDVLAPDTGVPPYAATPSYYFKFTTSAADTEGVTLRPKICLSLAVPDLALGTKQSQYDYANAYSNIQSMIVDYTYDFVYGHTAGQWGTAVTEQKAMQL